MARAIIPDLIWLFLLFFSIPYPPRTRTGSDLHVPMIEMRPSVPGVSSTSKRTVAQARFPNRRRTSRDKFQVVGEPKALPPLEHAAASRVEGLNMPVVKGEANTREGVETLRL
jgi:hypothetical protein